MGWRRSSLASERLQRCPRSPALRHGTRSRRAPPGANFWKPSTTTRLPGSVHPRSGSRSPSVRPSRTGCSIGAALVVDDENSAPPALLRWIAWARHGDGVGAHALLDLHAHIRAGQQVGVGIGELARARVTLVGAGIDGDVREQQLAFVRIGRAIVEHQARAAPPPAHGFQAAARNFVLERVELGDRLGEVGIDRDRVAGWWRNASASFLGRPARLP